MTRTTLVLALLAAAAAAAGCTKDAPTAPPAPVAQPPQPPAAKRPRVAVRRGDVRETVAAIGSFAARRTSRVGPQVSGRLAEVLVDVGDAVRAGQELARLDRSLFEIEADQARAAVASAESHAAASEPAIATAEADLRAAEAAHADARANLDRMRLLWERPDGGTPSIPKSRFDDASYRVDQTAAAVEAARSRIAESRARQAEARAHVAQARESVRHAEQRLAETVVRAPFDGVVTQRLADPGEPVTAAPVTHLLEVQDTATLELVFSLSQTYLAAARSGMPLEFDVEGVPGGAASAAVGTVFPALDEATRSFRCRALVANPGGRWRPGLLAQVRAEIRAAKGCLVVPVGALRRTPSGWQVLVETAGGDEPRAVEVGITAEDLAEIRSGLAEGDRVVSAADGAAR